MKERDYYVTPKSTAIMRFLWKAVSGDRYLLERATYSDQIKYMKHNTGGKQPLPASLWRQLLKRQVDKTPKLTP